MRQQRIWRINRGWRRRKDKNQLGFYINPITGLWSKQDDPNNNDDDVKEDGAMEKVASQRIVPFVEDHRNLLILAPLVTPSKEAMATVQSALKRGVEMTFQIEESELVAEPLPKLDDRKSLLFYEAAEGGAGVLTRLASEPESLAIVANKALEIMHFQKADNELWDASKLVASEKKDDLGNGVCEAGCYQCLLSYFNQPDHENINRRNSEALELLVALANSSVQLESVVTSDSYVAGASNDDIASDFLNEIAKQGLNQPTSTYVTVSGGEATAIAQYKITRTLVFTDVVSEDIIRTLNDKGWACISASDSSQWNTLFNDHADVFGAVRKPD